MTAAEFHQKYPFVSIEEIQSELDRWEEAKRTTPSRADVDEAYDAQESARVKWEQKRGTPEEDRAAEAFRNAVSDMNGKFEMWQFAESGPQFSRSVFVHQIISG